MTELLRANRAQRHADGRDALKVTFVPGGTPRAGRRPLVATIELVRQ